MASVVRELSCSDVTALAHPARWKRRRLTLSDCVAATSIEEHDNALRYDYPMFSQPMTSADFIDAIG